MVRPVGRGGELAWQALFWVKANQMMRPVTRLRSLPSPLCLLLVAIAILPVRMGAVALGDADDRSGGIGSRLVVMRDFNRDGIGDMAEIVSSAAGGQDVLVVSLGQADGSFKEAGRRQTLAHRPQAMVSGDFNKDGVPDLVVGDEDGGLMLFLGDGRGGLQPAGEVAHLDSVGSIVVADFNRDGIADLAVSDWRASTVKLLLGEGNGSFQSGWSFPLRMAGTTPHLTVADFNGDGWMDLAVVYSSDDGASYDVMLGDGQGAFVHSPRLSFVPDPYAHCVTSN